MESTGVDQSHSKIRGILRMTMIISLVSPKGGVGKSTCCIGLARSKVFRKKFKSIAMVELDPQGSLSGWARDRKTHYGAKEGEGFYKIFEGDDEMLKQHMLDIFKKYECVFIDVAGESTAKFSTTFAMMISDLVLIPMRTSQFDEGSFVANTYPVINEVAYDSGGNLRSVSKFKILPYFSNPTAKMHRVIDYFNEILPTGMEPINATISRRQVLENFNRGGRDLHEYKKLVAGNKEHFLQATQAIKEFEILAAKIIELSANKGKA